jgi:hypothetical protein
MYGLCVYVYKPLPRGVYPVAVDKYININLHSTKLRKFIRYVNNNMRPKKNVEDYENNDRFRGFSLAFLHENLPYATQWRVH